MVLGGSRNPAQAELDRTLRELVTRQKALDKRVERLETLEFDQKSVGDGCVSFVDSVGYIAPINAQATFTLTFPATLASGNRPYSQATVFWALQTDDPAAMVNLFMRWRTGAGPIAVANYNYAHKYWRAGALAGGNLDNQTEWLIGRIPGGVYEATGVVWAPFHSGSPFHAFAFGSWAAYDISQSVNSREEKGEWGGHYTGVGGGDTIQGFEIFAGAGNISGSAYLYGWCPEMTNAGGPDD